MNATLRDELEFAMTRRIAELEQQGRDRDAFWLRRALGNVPRMDDESMAWWIKDLTGKKAAASK